MTPSRIFVLLFFLLLPGIQVSVIAQRPKKSKVNILHADKLLIERQSGIRKLKGNVRLKHEGVFMQCDSALIYDRTNIVEAYENVFINQGDTVFLYGDRLHYDGNTEVADVTGNVRLVDKESVLTTNKLTFDLNNNTGYYLDGGKIKDDDNILTSRIGFYFSKTKTYQYRGEVEILTPDYAIRSDTMHYNTETNITRFLGPTEIRGDSIYIHCERGWYNLESETSRFSGNARLKTKEHTILGDTLFYDKEKKYGYGIGNVSMTDTIQDITLKGNKAWYWENPERTLVTDSALFIQTGNKKPLFLHADTLRSYTDTTAEKYRVLTAYYGVGIYREDLQGRCDSLSYSFQDSVIRMYRFPVLWSDENQLTSEYIELYTRNREPWRLEMYGNAFIISQQDSIHYNQIKGKNMYGYFREGSLYRILVKGNGQTIYYPEDNGELIGFNKAESSDISISVRDNQIQSITLLNAPKGNLDPPEKPSLGEQRLEGFIWLDQRRPKSVRDIFRKN